MINAFRLWLDRKRNNGQTSRRCPVEKTGHVDPKSSERLDDGALLLCIELVEGTDDRVNRISLAR